MNRLEFMKELASLLEDLPREEKIEILKYYNGYFDDAGEENEEAIIEELGSPAQVAASVKAGMDESTAEDVEFTEKGVDDGRSAKRYEETHQTARKAETGAQTRYEYTASRDTQNTERSGRSGRGWKILAIALLVILTFPVWIGIVAGLFGILVGLLAAVGGICLAAIVALAACLVSGIISIVCGFAKLLLSPLGGVMSISAGLLLLGAGCLCIVLCYLIFGKLIPLVFRGMCNLFRYIGGLFHGRTRA